MSESIVPGGWLPAQRIEQIGNEQLPAYPLPIHVDIAKVLEQQVPWALNQLIVPPTEGEPLQPILLLQPSQHHGRSFVTDIRNLRAGNLQRLPSPEPQVIWQDEFGNPYSSLSYKGNLGQNIEIHAGSADPKGLRFNGLQTSYSLERCVKASRLLREQGIDTEYITGAYMPEVLPYQHQTLGQTALKQRLYVEAQLANLEFAARNQTKWDKAVAQRSGVLDAEELEALLTAFQESSFVVTSRAMLTSDRLLDVLEQDAPTSQSMLDRAIRLQTILKNFKPSAQPEAGSTYEQYLGDFFPKQLGTYIRKIHELGLAHRMLHPGNMTTSAGIIDLDSVVGPAIGLEERDHAVTKEDTVLDFTFYLFDRRHNQSIAGLFRNLTEKNILPEHSPAYGNFLKNLYVAYTSGTADRTGTNMLTDDELLKYVTAAYSPEITNTFTAMPIEVTLFEDLTTTFTIEGLDKGIGRGLFTATNSFERYMARSELHSYARDAIYNWLIGEPGRPLYEFERQFADVTTEEDRQIAVNLIINDAFSSKRENEEVSRAERMTAAVIDTYETYSREHPAIAFPGSETIRAAGREINTVTDMPLEQALQLLSASKLPIASVHIKQHFTDTAEAQHRWDHATEQEFAGLVLTNLSQGSLQPKLYGLHEARIDSLAAEKVRDEEVSTRGVSFIVDRARRVYEAEEIGYVPHIIGQKHSLIHFDPGQYIAYLNPTDEGLSLSIESYDSPEVITQQLASTRFARISPTETIDQPLEALSYAERLLGTSAS